MAGPWRVLTGDVGGEPAPNLGGDRLVLIDGLRGLAALAVVLFHYVQFAGFAPGVPHSPELVATRPGASVLALFYEQGHRAVPVFWMISGFVLAHVYCGRDETTRGFVVNRLARLYPLHLATLLVVAVLQLLALQRLGGWAVYAHNDAYHFVLNLLFVSNWGLERGLSYNGPIWSVSVELIAYALFWISRRRLLARGITHPALVMAAALAWIATFGDSDIARCIFYFFAGCALLALSRALAGRRTALLGVALAMGLTGVAALAIAYPGMTQFVGLPGLFGGVILGLATSDEVARGRSRLVCGAIGDLSYGIYLWHFPIQLAIIVALAPHVDLAALSANGWFLAGYLGIVVAVARIGFGAIERPLRSRLRAWGGAPHRSRAEPAR